MGAQPILEHNDNRNRNRTINFRCERTLGKINVELCLIFYVNFLGRVLLKGCYVFYIIAFT